MVAAHKNRKTPRAQVSLIARYRSPTAFDFVAEECHDLSTGGMFIRSPAPAPAGTLLKLECDVDRNVGALRAVARVVWLREQDQQGEPAGMGVKFVKLDPAGRELIQQLLDASESSEGAGPAARGSVPAAVPADAPSSTEAEAPQRAQAASEPETEAASASSSTSATASASAVSALDVVAATVAAEPAPAARSKNAALTPRPSATRSPEVNRTPVMIGAALLLGVVVIALIGRKERPPEPLEAVPEVAAATAPTGAPHPIVQQERTAPAAAPAALRFALQLTTIPDAARVTIGERSVVSPALIELGMLSAPVEIRAEKEGFETLTATIDLDRFSERDGQRIATVTLALPPLPQEAPSAAATTAEPLKAATPAPVVAPAPRETRRSREPSKTVSASSAPKPEAAPVTTAPAAITPPASPAPVAAEAKPQPAPKETPLQTAMSCLARGDNACVIAALEGKARAPGELEMLIETYRAMGQSDAAERHMSTYVQKFPTERRAAGYRRLIERDAPASAPAPAPEVTATTAQ